MNTHGEKSTDTGNSTLEEAATPRSPKVLASPSYSESAECPRKVIRGESFNNPHTNNPTQVALTDWLNVTFPFDIQSTSIPIFLDHINSYFGDVFGGLNSCGKGLLGYHESYSFENGGVKFAFGGQCGTAFLSLPGEGCALVKDWNSVSHLLEHELHGRITRWDGAVDDFKGEHSVDLAMKWYLSGYIHTRGNKPVMSQAGNWEEPDGRGRTLYLGKRKNGKLLRVYEKGKQLGDPKSPWVRWEISLGKRGRQIPFDVLTNPRPFIAGAYSGLDWISEEASRIKTIQKTGEISYGHLVESARNSYGRLFDVMCKIEGSPEAAFKKLIVPGKPKRLNLPGMTDLLGDK